MRPTNHQLHQFINQFFNEEELDSLCFDYFPECLNDFGSGMSKNRKVLILIDHCERLDRLAALYASLIRERLDAWNRTFATLPFEKLDFVKESRLKEDGFNPRQIFLSHATGDAEFAHTLAADLQDEGWQVWIAPESIYPGEKWVEAISRGLETSGIFIVVLTPAAVASRWVVDETNAAIEMNKREEIRFVPINVMESNLPPLWRQFQQITFRENYKAGLNDLLNWLTGKYQGVAITSRSLIIRERQPELVESLPIYESRIDETTEIELIKIPAGPFIFGIDPNSLVFRRRSNRQQKIELAEYWIGRFPVTNRQFIRFFESTGYERLHHHLKWHKVSFENVSQEKLDHPVVNVSWDDAKAFCDWAKMRLPSGEQWEKAARGVDGRLWPWGSSEPTKVLCNVDLFRGDTTSVGSYSPHGDSIYGCADIVGNVWEWIDSGYPESPLQPVGGGAWNYPSWSALPADRIDIIKTTYRNSIGFRVVLPFLRSWLLIPGSEHHH